eukprot:jgi/Botrbrau1/10098/Bobra.20_2s0006.1
MRHIGRTWELHKLLIPTLFMLRARCAPSMQPGGERGLGDNLFENGFDEDMKPVLSIALTQLNIYRPDVVAPAVHVTCGDGTGNFSRDINLSCSSATSTCTDMTATFSPKVFIGNLQIAYQSFCRIGIGETGDRSRTWFDPGDENCLFTHKHFVHESLTSTFTCNGPYGNYVLSCIAGCPSTSEGGFARDNTLARFQYIFAVSMMCFAMCVIVGGCLCWHSYYRGGRDHHASRQHEEVEGPSPLSFSQPPRMLQAGSPRTPARSYPPCGPVVIISFGKSSTPREEFSSGVVCLGVPELPGVPAGSNSCKSYQGH